MTSTKSLVWCNWLMVFYSLPKYTRQGHGDDSHDESVDPAQGVRHPAEEVGAKQHAEHVESAVDGPGATSVTDQTKVLDQTRGDQTVIIDQVLRLAALTSTALS